MLPGNKYVIKLENKDVLFSAVKPLKGEVALNKNQIISIGTGVPYSTERRLFLIEGRGVKLKQKIMVTTVFTSLEVTILKHGNSLPAMTARPGR